MIYLIAIVALLILACRKDVPSSDPIINPPPPPPAPTEYIPIYNACDTSLGKAYALKSTKRWLAGALCRSYGFNGKIYWLIELSTCATEGFARESVLFSGIPDENPHQKFDLDYWKNGMKNGTVRPGYYLLGADGDVLEDIYVMDTTDMTLNFIEIDSWDTLNKRVEGHFSFTGVIQEPRYNPINPNKVQLASGRFWLKLP